MEPVRRKHRSSVVLVGFMGTGKSSTGRALARRLDRRYYDTDALIARSAGKTIPELFATLGEAAFRELEAEAVREAAEHGASVIATGGGVLERDENLDALRRAGVIICLTARPDIIVARTAPWEGRPMLKTAATPEEAVTRLLAARAPRYALADWTVDTSDRQRGEVLDLICSELPSLYQRITTTS